MSRKNLLKVVKFQHLVENVVFLESITLQSLQIFYAIVLRGEIFTTFCSKNNSNFNKNMENLRTSQGYIFPMLYSILRPNFGFILLSNCSFQYLFPGLA